MLGVFGNISERMSSLLPTGVAGSNKFSRRRIVVAKLRELLLTGSASPLIERYLYSAAHALGCEHEIDFATELVRDEFEYQACPVARLDRSHDRWTAKLTPFD